jgi:hypothetical protein
VTRGTISSAYNFVMPGLVPGIHVLAKRTAPKDVEGGDKPGHDE